ncbi:MAG: hypothetical protein NZ480_04145 [Bdellovibrionaceae bacterium]|nr:hypothetical protein [Pseudobdellovibrionaceae bacterium]MDW8189950.1 hypothetical protein [Pseudobdellovibrionaceae bacterium]
MTQNFIKLIRFHPWLKPFKRKKPIELVQRRGQGLVEYLILVALIAIAAIASVQFLGQTFRYKLAQISSELGASTPGIKRPHMEPGLTAKKNLRNLFDHSSPSEREE